MNRQRDAERREDEGMGAFAYAVVLVVIAAAGGVWAIVAWVQR